MMRSLFTQDMMMPKESLDVECNILKNSEQISFEGAVENKKGDPVLLPVQEMNADNFYPKIPIMEQAAQPELDLGPSTSLMNISKNVESNLNRRDFISETDLCPLCDEFFENKSSIEMHLIESHKIEKEKLKTFMASLKELNSTSGHCTNLTSTDVSSSNASNILTTEVVGTKVYTCTKCGAYHDSLKNLESHLEYVCVRNDILISAIPEKACTQYTNKSTRPPQQFSSLDQFFNNQIDSKLKVINPASLNLLPTVEAGSVSHQQNNPISFEENLIPPVSSSTNAKKARVSPVLNSEINSSEGAINLVLSHNIQKRNEESDIKPDHQINCQKIESEFHKSQKPKRGIKRQILVNYGLENAIHFNENSQCKIKPDDNIEDSHSFQNKDSNLVQSQIGTDSLEKRKYTCNICWKSFTGVWILKLHEELIHGINIPVKAVENIAEEYREMKQENKSNLVSENIVKKRTQYFKSNDKGATNKNSVTDFTSSNDDFSQPSKVENLPKKMHMPNTDCKFIPNYVDPQMLFQMSFYEQYIRNMVYGKNLSASPDTSKNMNVPITVRNMLPPSTTSTLSNPLIASAYPFLQMPMGAVNSPVFTAPLLGMQSKKPVAPKRRRSKINNAQVAILRKYFNVHSTPTTLQIKEMSQQTGLDEKVVYNWYRNNVFRERQRDIHSAYNFNNPPSAFLNTDV